MRETKAVFLPFLTSLQSTSPRPRPLQVLSRNGNSDLAVVLERDVSIPRCWSTGTPSRREAYVLSNWYGHETVEDTDDYQHQ